MRVDDYMVNTAVEGMLIIIENCYLWAGVQLVRKMFLCTKSFNFFLFCFVLLLFLSIYGHKCTFERNAGCLSLYCELPSGFAYERESAFLHWGKAAYLGGIRGKVEAGIPEILIVMSKSHKWKL